MFSSAGRTRTHIGGRQVLGMNLGEKELAVAQMLSSCCSRRNDLGSQPVGGLDKKQAQEERYSPASIEENQP